MMICVEEQNHLAPSCILFSLDKEGRKVVKNLLVVGGCHTSRRQASPFKKENKIK